MTEEGKPGIRGVLSSNRAGVGGNVQKDFEHQFLPPLKSNFLAYLPRG